MNDDFDRFDKIFGITSSAKIKKASKTAPPKSKKRRSLPNKSKLSCGPELPIKRVRGNSLKKEVVCESPDKTEVITHLSCHAADFHKSLISNSDDSDSEDEK